MENGNKGAAFEFLKSVPDKILEQLKILSAEKRNCENKINELEQTLANILCPFKVGDDITICGYSHADKKGKVEKVMGHYYEQTKDCDPIDYKTILSEIKGNFCWIVSGYVYKKNGGLSKMVFDFNSNAYNRYLKEKESENRCYKWY